MMKQTNGHVGRRCGLLALAGAVVAGPACFLPLPPVDADPATSDEASTAGVSTGEAPTTSGDAGSTGGSSSGAGSTSGSTTAAEGEEGTTEFSLPTCPYAPPGTVVHLTTSDDGDLSVQACGATKQFTHLKLTAIAGTMTFAECSDESCGDCVANDEVALDLVIPDPFSTFGLGVFEGGCYALDMKWERPTPDDGAQCTGSTVVLRRLEGGQAEVVPSLLFRISSALDVVDTVGEFSLAAASAGPGTIACPCEGDCCRESPGTRDVQFTVTVDGEQFMAEPLMAEQAQEVPLGDEANIAGISLVRSHFPSECSALAAYEWVFRFPGAL